MFCNNAIKTTKYTWYNFFPKSLFEQFRRIVSTIVSDTYITTAISYLQFDLTDSLFTQANFYFLLTALVQILGYFTDLYASPFNGLTTTLTLVSLHANAEAQLSG